MAKDLKNLRSLVSDAIPGIIGQLPSMLTCYVWFASTTSTSILSICLNQTPYNGDWLHVISTILFVLSVVLFILFLCISCLRYTLYPRLVPAVLRLSHQSLFPATVSIGLATIIDMVVLVNAPTWDQELMIFT